MIYKMISFWLGISYTIDKICCYGYTRLSRGQKPTPKIILLSGVRGGEEPKMRHFAPQIHRRKEKKSIQEPVERRMSTVPCELQERTSARTYPLQTYTQKNIKKEHEQSDDQ